MLEAVHGQRKKSNYVYGNRKFEVLAEKVVYLVVHCVAVTSVHGALQE